MAHFSLEEEIRELLKHYPDPRKGADGILEFRRRKVQEAVLPRFGTGGG